MKIDNQRFRYALNLQTFADEPGDPPQDPPSEPPAPRKLEMTQEEFDARIADRLARERRKYADYDDIKTKLSTFEQAEEERRKAAMTEKERLEAERDAEKKRADDVDSGAKAKLEAANQRLIKAEFRAQARELGVRADALDDAFKLADISSITVDDEGNAAGVVDVVKALLVNKPFLVETTNPRPRIIGEPSNPIQDEVKTLEQQLEEAQRKKDFSKVIELSNKIKSLTRAK